MKIQISNNPQIPNVTREFEFGILETDLLTYAKIKGFVKYYTEEGKTPLGMNPNGLYYDPIADKTTRVNSATGEYDINGDTTEIDYLRNTPVSVIEQILGKENITVGEVLEYLVEASVLKQDKYKRFDK